MLISNKNVKYSLKCMNMYYWVRVKVMMFIIIIYNIYIAHYLIKITLSA